MTDEYKIFPQPVTKDGTLIIIQTGSLENHNVKIYNLTEVVELLNKLTHENQLWENQWENDELIRREYITDAFQRHYTGWRGVYNPIDESEIMEMMIIKDLADDIGIELK